MLTAAFFFIAAVGVAACFVWFFGDPETDDFLGRASKLIGVSVPSGIVHVAKVLRIWWVFRGIGRAADFFINERHPIIQILYVVLVFGGYGAFVLKGYPLLPNPYFAGYHKVIGAILFLLCVVTFILTSFSDPGIITKANVSGYVELFPYDGFMYTQRPCTGCDNIDKVARSKHCRYLKACVARYDHYCIWMNNTVGYRNYRWFLAYLVCNSALMLYGIAAGASIFLTEITSKQLLEATFVNSRTGERIPAGATIIMNYFLFHFPELVFVTILCCVMGLVVTGFSVYNLALAATAVTANEAVKWREAAEYRSDAVARYNKWKRAKDSGHPLPPPAHVVLCATGACRHEQHAGNKGKPAPTEWNLEEPVPLPKNAYTRGFIGNIKSVLWPMEPKSREPPNDKPLVSGQSKKKQ